MRSWGLVCHMLHTRLPPSTRTRQAILRLNHTSQGTNSMGGEKFNQSIIRGTPDMVIISLSHDQTTRPFPPPTPWPLPPQRNTRTSLLLGRCRRILLLLLLVHRHAILSVVAARACRERVIRCPGKRACAGESQQRPLRSSGRAHLHEILNPRPWTLNPTP